jgi:hypothetical protein
MNHANFAETTLAAAITDTSGTAITVTSGASFPAAPFIISIGTEALSVTSKGAGTDWTVTRGYEGSTAATHLNGAAIYHDWSAGEADSAARAFVTVHQASHPFAAGDVIYCSGANTYAKAKADDAATADVVGVVSEDVGTDDFTFCMGGVMTTGVPAVAAGTVLFLSDATAGLLTATEPTTVGHISLPVAIVTENAVSMIVYSWRGAEIGTAGAGPVVESFTTAMTQANFLTMVADMSIDVIEMQGGAYQDWHAVAIDVDRTARPLLIRPAPGAQVIWDGTTDDSGDGVFYFGGNSKTAYITFDPAGTGGSFLIQNYALGQTGLVNTAYASHITVNGFKVRTCTETSASGTTRFSVYVSHDGAHRSDNLTFNDWDSYPGATFNHFQVSTSSTYGVDGVTVRNWKAKDGTYGVVLRGDSTAIVMDGWTMDDVTTPFDDETGGAIASNNTAINSGLVNWLSYAADGGGNHWNSLGDHYALGNTTKLYAAGESIGRMNLLRMGTDGKWMQADKDTAAKTTGLLGIALEAKENTQLMLVALPGSWVRDDSWGWTVGATLYVSDGEMTETAPSAADDYVRIVGYAVTADIIWFEPEQMVVTATGRSILDDASTGAVLTTLGAAPLAPTAAAYTPATGAQTVALDVTSANMHVVTGHASGTAITFTVTGATNNQPFVVSILQGGTTVSTIAAWFATIRWAGGTAPILTATLNKRDTFGFIRTGANTYDGFVIGQSA